jgi:hypothetical protein
MKAHALVNAGVCGFKTKITAKTEDGRNVALRMGSNCKTIKELGRELCSKNPFDALLELMPTAESAVLATCRPVLQKKGGCEACVVPVAVCKTLQVAANLALPRDVTIKLTKG